VSTWVGLVSEQRRGGAADVGEGAIALLERGVRFHLDLPETAPAAASGR